MSAIDVLRRVSDALVIAGPLLERFGLKDAALTKTILEGSRDLLDAAQAAIGGAQQLDPEIDELIEEFRRLRSAGDLTVNDFRELDARIKSKTDKLREVVEANRG